MQKVRYASTVGSHAPPSRRSLPTGSRITKSDQIDPGADLSPLRVDTSQAPCIPLHWPPVWYLHPSPGQVKLRINPRSLVRVLADPPSPV